jgi:hypothetical protein
MAIQPVAFAPPKKEVGKKSGRKSSLAEPLGGVLGAVGGIAGGIVGGAAGAKAGGAPAVPGAIQGSIAGAAGGLALGTTLGQLIDPGEKAKAGRIEFGQVQQAPTLNSKELGFQPSRRSTQIAEALAALPTQGPEAQMAYTEPLSIGLVSSLAVDKETAAPGQPVGVA